LTARNYFYRISKILKILWSERLESGRSARICDGGETVSSYAQQIELRKDKRKFATSVVKTELVKN